MCTHHPCAKYFCNNYVLYMAILVSIGYYQITDKIGIIKLLNGLIGKDLRCIVQRNIIFAYLKNVWIFCGNEYIPKHFPPIHLNWEWRGTISLCVKNARNFYQGSGDMTSINVRFICQPGFPCEKDQTFPSLACLITSTFAIQIVVSERFTQKYQQL